MDISITLGRDVPNLNSHSVLYAKFRPVSSGIPRRHKKWEILIKWRLFRDFLIFGSLAEFVAFCDF